MRHLLLFTIGYLSLYYFCTGSGCQGVGAFILVSQQGDVTYLGADGSFLAQAVPAGKPIPLSHTIITGMNGVNWSVS